MKRFFGFVGEFHPVKNAFVKELNETVLTHKSISVVSETEDKVQYFLDIPLKNVTSILAGLVTCRANSISLDQESKKAAEKLGLEVDDVSNIFVNICELVFEIKDKVKEICGSVLKVKIEGEFEILFNGENVSDAKSLNAESESADADNQEVLLRIPESYLPVFEKSFFDYIKFYELSGFYQRFLEIKKSEIEKARKNGGIYTPMEKFQWSIGLLLLAVKEYHKCEKLALTIQLGWKRVKMGAKPVIEQFPKELNKYVTCQSHVRNLDLVKIDDFFGTELYKKFLKMKLYHEVSFVLSYINQHAQDPSVYHFDNDRKPSAFYLHVESYDGTEDLKKLELKVIPFLDKGSSCKIYSDQFKKLDMCLKKAGKLKQFFEYGPKLYKSVPLSSVLTQEMHKKLKVVRALLLKAHDKSFAAYSKEKEDEKFTIKIKDLEDFFNGNNLNPSDSYDDFRNFLENYQVDYNPFELNETTLYIRLGVFYNDKLIEQLGIDMEALRKQEQSVADAQKAQPENSVGFFVNSAESEDEEGPATCASNLKLNPSDSDE